ncbi:MAG: CBS domain-containing protein [Humidesulfovibrio sp.]
MLFRKRAWDLMREEYAWVDESASLAEAVRALRQSQKASPEDNVVLVLGRSPGGETRRLKGAVSVWKVLEAVDECVLRDPELKVACETDFDKTFARACAVCIHTSLARYMEADVPVLKPGDPLPVVLELFLRKRRGWAVVEENGRVLGVVLVADVYRELSADMVGAFQPGAGA